MEPASAAGPDGERGGGGALGTAIGGAHRLSGVLSYLERLEMQASLSHEKSGKLQRAQAEVNALRTKIQKLRQLRDELKAEVTQRQALVQAATASLEPDQTVGMSAQEVLERRWENAKVILQAYRFTGLSGQLTSRGVCVHINTAFEDHLLDSYFVDLVLQKPLRIHRHSVPAFIPLEKMAAQHLQTDIQCFLFALCQHLNAYAGRKYQADRLQDDFAALLTGPLQRNSPCSVLSFTYKVDSGTQCVPFSARLLYRDLTGTLPTDVTIACLGAEGLPSSWERRRAAHRTLFSMKPLHKVFASFARGEKLDLSLTS